MTRLRRENQKIEASISDCIVFFSIHLVMTVEAVALHKVDLCRRPKRIPWTSANGSSEPCGVHCDACMITRSIVAMVCFGKVSPDREGLAVGINADI
jgi:hypothetical protein